MSPSCSALDFKTLEETKRELPNLVRNGDVGVSFSDDGVFVKCAGCGTTAQVTDEELQGTLLAITANRNGGMMS